jgi:hypothetical protein
MTNEITPAVGIVAAAFCFLVGGWLLGWGFRKFLKARRAESAGVRVPGRVVEHTVRVDSENVKIHYPIVEFTTAAGKIVRVESSSGTSDFLKTPVGGNVLIDYDPQRPENAHIVGSEFLAVAILCFLGGGFCLFGLLALAAAFFLPH